MKKVLFGCIGAGLAVGGAYFLYKKWQKSQQQCQEKNNEPTLEKSEYFIPNLKGTDIDEDALYGDINEFFASLLKAGGVSHPDGGHTAVEPGQIFKAGPSSYASSPSTSVFQPNVAGTKKASEQLADRRRRTRKHKKEKRRLPLTPLKQT